MTDGKSDRPKEPRRKGISCFLYKHYCFRIVVRHFPDSLTYKKAATTTGNLGPGSQLTSSDSHRFLFSLSFYNSPLLSDLPLTLLNLRRPPSAIPPSAAPSLAQGVKKFREDLVAGSYHRDECKEVPRRPPRRHTECSRQRIK